MKTCTAFVLFLLLTAPLFAYTVGHKQVVLKDEKRQRTLKTDLFYPSEQSPKKTLGENIVFYGINTAPNASFIQEQSPLLLVSHGFGGNSLNHLPFIKHLVKKGFIVAAANHQGSTTGNLKLSSAIEFWKQTQDLSFILDKLLKESMFKDYINPEHIGVMGHSKGGYSALALLGAQTSHERYVSLCKKEPTDAHCAPFLKAGLNISELNKKAFEASYKDKRFAYAIALDPAFAKVYKTGSLKALDKPFLLLSADYYRSDKQNDNLHVDTLFKRMSHGSLGFLVKESSHFSFLRLCKPKAVYILAEDGEAFVCQELSKTRQEIHQESISYMELFFRLHKL